MNGEGVRCFGQKKQRGGLTACPAKQRGVGHFVGAGCAFDGRSGEVDRGHWTEQVKWISKLP